MCGSAIASLMALSGIVIGGIAIMACECRCNHPDKPLPPLK